MPTYIFELLDDIIIKTREDILTLKNHTFNSLWLTTGIHYYQLHNRQKIS